MTRKWQELLTKFMTSIYCTNMQEEKEMAYEPADAIDLSHHLSLVARNRTLSPLKAFHKYLQKPGLISLAGGLPSPECFPFDVIKADVLSHDAFPITATSTRSWFWSLFSRSTNTISIPRYADQPQAIDLASSLQYSLATGLPQLKKICKEVSGRIYQPAYANFTTIVHAGNTDGWAKSVITLCNPGEGVLCDEWTYPSALASMKPYNISAVPIPIDGQGMCSNALRDVLASWDENARGMPRPHVIYVVPVGQNPTGVTMEASRKKEIYDICVEYDIIIVEDDPYYFLQEGEYVPHSRRFAEVVEIDDEHYIARLSPSFLRFDYQGRVIRLDSFSKTVAPGCRLGWFTCNPMFAERIERAAETSTQAPSGFSQSLVCKLMLEWQFKGYLRWVKGLAARYARRRDFLVDLLVKKFAVEVEHSQDKLEGIPVFNVIFFQSGQKLPVFSFIPPTSGMFVWLKFSFDNHPSIHELGSKMLEEKLWIALAEAGLIIVPGSIFVADSSVLSVNNIGYFRISFSEAEDHVMVKAIDILAKVVKDFYQKI